MPSNKLAAKVKSDLENLADEVYSKTLSWFFKTGKGQYGEGDRFRGIRMPQLRKLAKSYINKLKLSDLNTIIKSEYHEDRMFALIWLTEAYKSSAKNEKPEIFDYYISKIKYINNWDLVDISCHKVIGAHLFELNDYSLLHEYVKSDSLWERRIAMISTFYSLNYNQLKISLEIAEKLIDDHEDLIHKAVGWVLREVGKKDTALLDKFLIKHYSRLSRTTLRYAIEKFEEPKRQIFLKGDFN